MATTSSREWLPVASIVIFTLQMIRLSILLIQHVSVQQDAADSTDNNTNGHGGSAATKVSSSTSGSSSAQRLWTSSVTNGSGSTNERQPLIAKPETDAVSTTTLVPTLRRQDIMIPKTILTITWLVLAIYLATSFATTTTMQIFSYTVTIVLLLEIALLWMMVDNDFVQRILQLLMGLTVWTVYGTAVVKEHYYNHSTIGAVLASLVLLASMLWQRRRHYYSIATTTATIVVVDGLEQQQQQHHADAKSLSMNARWKLVKPYVWPDETSSGDSALGNRVRAISTWLCVMGSKGCNIISPMFLGWATTALAHEDYANTVLYSVLYCLVSWTGSTLKEFQSLLYLKVAQAAFVQLASTAFWHLHSLSLDWHLRKQLGQVLRSMDRGIAACDTLMTYLFLWLLPAMFECLMVCAIFALYFDYFALAVAVFYFVFVYVVVTIVMTMWRKKFRKTLTKTDNDWHDKITDSLINFETVKFFTAEDYELQEFKAAVSRYQAGSVNVQGSLSFLNISQQVILKACLAVALTLATGAIQERSECCLATAGCESAISDCCRRTTLCPNGMQVGDFVAVLTYTLNLFAPLNFLGSVYNAIVMATIDLSNMSELLAENPDVTDAPDALELPRNPTTSDDICVEFDNVHFHYPTQSQERGLKGLSFKMKRGTTTAIVGPTGAGKTTISRLLFRFYDVMGGAVKINGVDVRSVSQRSLRSSIGVVPQVASMFNDTIRKNIHYGNLNASEQELFQAASDAQILNFIESLDKGWETMVGDRGLKLSGGERQRAAIARCLLKNPPICLLDEATSALDTLTENSVQEALDRLGQERTVLVIAHRLGTIRNADNIIVLKDGRVAEEGTHDALLKKAGVYAEMWNMQLHQTSASTSRTGLDQLG